MHSCRIDNLIYAPVTTDTVLAVLDWELSTLGYPLADLAYSAMCYHFPMSDKTGVRGLPTPLPEGKPPPTPPAPPSKPKALSLSTLKGLLFEYTVGHKGNSTRLLHCSKHSIVQHALVLAMTMRVHTAQCDILESCGPLLSMKHLLSSSSHSHACVLAIVEQHLDH